MSEIRSISDLQASARGHLEGNYKKSAGIIICYMLLCVFINFISPANTYAKSLVANIIALIISVLVEALPLLLKAGLYNFYIKVCCNTTFTTKDLFCGFTINGKRNFIYSLILLIAQNLFLIPTTLYVTALITSGQGSVETAFMILAVGIILNFILSIYVSQVFFLMFDFPDKSFIELIQLSAYLMRGHKLQYILIILGFLPLEILGCLSLGIGLIWVMPYKISTLACFYLDLTKASTSE